MNVPHVVIAIVEAKAGMESELRSALESVVLLSRAESTCLDYRLHASKNKPGQFILYEKWESEDAHQAQFEKPYIKEIAQKSDLLVDSLQVIFGEELSQQVEECR